MKRWIVTVAGFAIGLGVMGAAACGDTTEQATAKPGGAGAGRIDGTVTDADGSPIPGIRVGIVEGTAPFPEISPETDAEGHFSIAGVPPGTFDVAAHDREGNIVDLESVEVVSGQTAMVSFEVSSGAPSGAPVVIGSKSKMTVAQHPELGAILVDGDGFTLYLFTQDESNVSNCTGGCAQTWPPLQPSLVQLELAGEGVTRDLVGTITREGGIRQVTYNGRPLYNFSGDRSPGDTNGQNVGGVWFVVSPQGEAITESN